MGGMLRLQRVASLLNNHKVTLKTTRDASDSMTLRCCCVENVVSVCIVVVLIND